MVEAVVVVCMDESVGNDAVCRAAVTKIESGQFPATERAVAVSASPCSKQSVRRENTMSSWLKK